MKQADYWIEKLQLKPHPEGGHYKQTFQSNYNANVQSVDLSYAGARRCSSLIYYLLQSEDYSQFHKLKSDEVWLYHQGSGVKLYLIHLNGKLETLCLGPNIGNGEGLQLIIPENCWFAAEVMNEKTYSLVSCMVSPGFVFDDFELADRNKMLNEFPEHSDLIVRFTR